MARYIKQEMPDLRGTGENKCYYRLEKRRNIYPTPPIRNYSAAPTNS